MKRSENVTRMAVQLEHLRAALMDESITSLHEIRYWMRPSPHTVLSPQDVQEFYDTAVPTIMTLDTPCLIWSGARDSDDYGIFYAHGKRYAAHRLAYTLTQGYIPYGQEVCHACDVPACIRWEHLQIGTHAANMAEKVARGRAWNQHTPAVFRVPILPVQEVDYLEGQMVI